MMDNTPNGIAQWAADTFGPAATAESTLCRAYVELAELMSEWHNRREPAKVIAECADVYIVLCRYAKFKGVADRMDAFMVEDLMFLGNRGDVGQMLCEAATWLNNGLMNGDARNVLGGVCGRMARVVEIAAPGRNLLEAVNAKMVINRGRRWHLDGNGHGQHIKGT